MNHENCPISPIVGVFGGRWKTEILWALDDGGLRFNALKRAIPGISQKMLAQQLRQLERDGIVCREVFSERPVRVQYSLTELGKSLQPVFAELGAWGERHMADVVTARDAFDDAVDSTAEPAA